MKILAIADTEERCLWECFRKERFEGVDLILSAGDLDPDYLEFLVTVINKPLIYVRGNHDDRYACLLYTSPSPRDRQKSRMPSSA